MTQADATKQRYLVSFYQNGQCQIQYLALGSDAMNAHEVAKEFSRNTDGIDWAAYDVVVDDRPLTKRLTDGGVTVVRVASDKHMRQGR